MVAVNGRRIRNGRSVMPCASNRNSTASASSNATSSVPMITQVARRGRRRISSTSATRPTAQSSTGTALALAPDAASANAGIANHAPGPIGAPGRPPVIRSRISAISGKVMIQPYGTDSLAHTM